MAGYNYFAVEGPLGAGKSRLVEALAKRTGARIIKSPDEDNPFLKQFYRDPKHYAFQTQIFFLLARYRLLTTLFEMDLFHQTVVSDFIFERDELYARLLLGEAELRLYHQIEQHLRRDIPKPQLVIFLQAPVEILVRNVSERGRPFERKYLSEEFLSALSREYIEFFFNWDTTPLLVVDTGCVDVNDSKKVNELTDYILNTQIKGTQYYSEAALF